MKAHVWIVAFSLCAVLLLLNARAAYARTPIPTTTPIFTPAPTATPIPAPEHIAQFLGKVWLNVFGGYGKTGPVTARVDGTICATEAPPCPNPPCLVPPADPPPHTRDFHLDVVSAEVKPGCGYEGAPVAFYVGETPANTTAIWLAGASQEVNLTVGPPFAFFQGAVTFDPDLVRTGHELVWGINAYVGDVLCGRETRGVFAGLPYFVVVDSAEQKAGCGTEGAEVTFKLRDRAGNLVGAAREKGTWHAWGNGNTGQNVNLTMAPVEGGGIRVGNVGTGRAESTRLPWLGAAAALAVGGFAATAGGMALLRRAKR